MDGIFGFIIFAIILGISGLQKWKEYREEQEFRKGSDDRPTIEDLPEATRRMLYGDPNVRPAQLDDEEVVPIPVARPARRPEPPRPQPVQRQAPPPPPRPVQQPRRAVAPPPPPAPKPRPRPQRVEAKPTYTKPRPTPQKQHPSRPQIQAPAAQKRRTKDTSSRGLALRLIDHPTGVRAAIIANEILGKPISMREGQGGM